MTTKLVESLNARKKFIDSLTYYKKYLGDAQESSPEVQVEESRIVRPTFAQKRKRSISRVRKFKPTIRKRTIVAVQEQAMQAEFEAEPLPKMQANESNGARPILTMKRGRAVSHVRTINPKIQKRKRTWVFTVQEAVVEEEASLESETVSEKEITLEKFVSIDGNKLSDDDFYKILGFLESEKRKLDRITFAEN